MVELLAMLWCHLSVLVLCAGGLVDELENVSLWHGVPVCVVAGGLVVELEVDVLRSVMWNWFRCFGCCHVVYLRVWWCCSAGAIRWHSFVRVVVWSWFSLAR